MHGEYKVPGGKLVVVDLEIEDDRIARFRLAGDFFLEPDSALDDINEAVNGLPVESDATAIAAVKRGDTVVLGSGMIGKVTRVEEAEVNVEIAPSVNVRVVKAMIAEVRNRAAIAANDSKA